MEKKSVICNKTAEVDAKRFTAYPVEGRLTLHNLQSHHPAVGAKTPGSGLFQ